MHTWGNPGRTACRQLPTVDRGSTVQGRPKSTGDGAARWWSKVPLQLYRSGEHTSCAIWLPLDLPLAVCHPLQGPDVTAHSMGPTGLQNGGLPKPYRAPRLPCVSTSALRTQRNCSQAHSRTKHFSSQPQEFAGATKVRLGWEGWRSSAGMRLASAAMQSKRVAAPATARGGLGSCVRAAWPRKPRVSLSESESAQPNQPLLIL
jgi:hypothetical protein